MDEHTQILLGDPGTSLTTAVSKNVLRRERLPTVRAPARAAGLASLMRKQKKQRSRWLLQMYRATRTHLYFIRSDTLLPYAVGDRGARSFTGLCTTAVAMRLQYAASPAGLRSDSSKSDRGL